VRTAGLWLDLKGFLLVFLWHVWRSLLVYPLTSRKEELSRNRREQIEGGCLTSIIQPRGSDELGEEES
jgi:hypothetical protein